MRDIVAAIIEDDIDARLTPTLHAISLRVAPGQLDKSDMVEVQQSTLIALWRYAEKRAPEVTGRLLTTAELAARLQLSPKTVRRRAKAGQLTPIRFGGRGRGALRWPVEAAR